VTPPALRSNPGVAAKLEQERMLKAGITAHKTGLPKKLLELFAPLPPLPHEVSSSLLVHWNALACTKPKHSAVIYFS
jgi:hypothetical protein